MNLAPIVLFVYNRPWHTKQTLKAIYKNALASKSVLYIYADGPKSNATKEDLANISEVRSIIERKKWCGEVNVFESDRNKGLAASVIDGVTEIINKHGTVIILEDDIVASEGFLKYMNEALSLYSNEDKVGCIHGWNYHLDSSNYKESTFFLKGADCWGWATWKRAWDKFNPNGAELLRAIESGKQGHEFDRKGTHGFVAMLKDQIEGKNNSWAIRWCASLFLNNMYCLQPTKAIVKNIGLDNSGIHCGVTNFKQEPIDFIEIRKIGIEESDWFFQSYLQFLQPAKDISINKWQKFKQFLRR